MSKFSHQQHFSVGSQDHPASRPVGAEEVNHRSV